MGDTQSKKLLFVGASGHHYLADMLGRIDNAGRPYVSSAAYVGDGVDEANTQGILDRLARTAAGPHSLERVESFDRALDEFQPDVVSVGAVYAANGKFAAAALRRGLAVVCDKPIAGTWEMLAEVEATSKTSGASLVTEFDLRVRPHFAAARDAIASGQIGTPALVTVQKSYRWRTRPGWYADRSLYTSTLLWIASHGIDMADFVLRQEPTWFAARQTNVTKPQFGSAEDNVAVIMGYGAAGGTGPTTIVHADFLRPEATSTHGDDRLRVVGSEGQIEVLDGQAFITTTKEPRRPLTLPPEEPVGLVMFRAAIGGKSGFGSPDFNTAHSLRIARQLLLARDAADKAIAIATHR